MFGYLLEDVQSNNWFTYSTYMNLFPYFILKVLILQKVFDFYSYQSNLVYWSHSHILKLCINIKLQYMFVYLLIAYFIYLQEWYLRFFSHFTDLVENSVYL